MSHVFVATYFSSPTWCSYCGTFLWGVAHKQGYRCSLCQSIAHKKCRSAAGRCPNTRIPDASASTQQLVVNPCVPLVIQGDDAQEVVPVAEEDFHPPDNTTEDQLFNKYSTDLKTMTWSEFRNLAYTHKYYLSDECLRRTSYKIDSNKDRKLSREEFMTWWNGDRWNAIVQLKEEEAKISHVVKAFQTFDQNGDDMSSSTRRCDLL
eukprot:TRINITY_DN8153_c0_g1_i2.p1 TRINITY_DN8153_c0_g1~~TRINITY_DN8153_c0_g1_i2.p1  ORF type:complete len:206 (+),score=42.52 TRINITY_DN8153_c0_g1_i2:135-752(+)